MKRRVYIETTVVSYLTARPSRDLLVAAHQAATRELWRLLDEHYEPCVSVLVHEEGRRGDAAQAGKRLAAIAAFTTLAVDDDSKRLAQNLSFRVYSSNLM